jgi:hypothetical protein
MRNFMAIRWESEQRLTGGNWMNSGDTVWQCWTNTGKVVVLAHCS